MSIVREFAAVLGLTLDAASFRDGNRALANIAAELKKQQKDVAKSPLLTGGILGDSGKANLGGVVEGLSAVGTAAEGVASKLYNAFAGIFDEVGKLSSALGKVASGAGETAQRVQGLSYSVKGAGVDLGQLQSTLQDLQAKQYATKFSGDAILAWSRLGVSVRDASGKFKPAAQLFEDSVAALIKVKEPAERTGRALATVGQAGLDVANYWRDRGGLEAFKEAQKEVALFGAELGDVDRNAISGFSTNTNRLQLVLQGLKNSVAGPLYQALGSVAEQFVAWVKTQKGVNDGVRDSVSQLAKLGPPLLAVAKAAYTYLIPAIGTVVEVLAGLGNVVGNVLTFALEKIVPAFDGFGTVGKAVAAVVFAAFFPLTALFLGIAGLIEDLIVFSQGGSSVTGRAVEAFRKWRDEIFAAGKPEWLGGLEDGLKSIERLAKGVYTAVKALFKAAEDFALGPFRDLAAIADKLSPKLEDGAKKQGPGFFGKGGGLDAGYGFVKGFLGGLSPFGGIPGAERPQVPVPTVPVSDIDYAQQRSGAGGQAGQSLPPIVVSQTFSGGNLGSLKEVRDLAKNATEEGINEALLTIVRSIPGGAA